MTVLIPKNELNEFSLPRVCVVTGQPGPVEFRKVQFQWFPRWIAGFAIVPLLYLILFFALRKSASGTLPFSAEGWARAQAARRNVVIATLGLVGSLAAGVFLTAQREEVGGPLLLVGLVGGLGALVVTGVQMRSRHPQATHIDDRSVTLKLPSLEAENVITAHLSAGGADDGGGSHLRVVRGARADTRRVGLPALRHLRLP